MEGCGRARAVHADNGRSIHQILKVSLTPQPKMAFPVQTMRSTNSHFLSRLGQAVSRLFRQPRLCVIVVGLDARVNLLATELAAARGEKPCVVLPDPEIEL